MRIARGLLTLEDVRAALAQESSTTRALVPDDSHMQALFNHEGADGWAYRRFEGEFTPVPGQIVTVRKSSHGVRPIAQLSIRDRLLYRAITRRWKDALPEPNRSSEAYEAFVNAPLGAAVVPPYVVSSDVTACYEYIDHGLLAREILARTGDSDGVEALENLLAGVMGRSFGLPQQSGSSDVLAEAYLSVVERRLLRRGLAVSRYNDDFRIAVDSWGEALEAVDELQRECRAIGLVLNDFKTVISKGATYEKELGRRAKVLKEISEDVEADLAGVIRGSYEDVFDELPEGAVSVRAGQRIVAEWHALQAQMVAGDLRSSLDRDKQDRRLALTGLLGWAFSVLATEPVTDSEALEACGQILRTEQTLTPVVAKYITNGADEQAAIDWFEEFLGGRPYLTPWQVWWIAPAFQASSRSYAVGTAQRDWLESVWKTSAFPEPVRAGIAFTVAQKGLADAQGLMEVYESMTDTGRPFVARAVGAVASVGDAGAATLSHEDEWVRWAFESGQRDA